MGKCMNDADLVTRLKALSSFAEIPPEELEWLTLHGQCMEGAAGAIVAPKGKRIEDLWIVLSGHLAIRVDRGAGLHRVLDWRTGDVGGLLPYSRMTGPPGDAYFEEKTNLLLIHEKHFPEMIHRCPVFTAHTVHIMLDRARTFNTSELQDEKMITLGRLAAGLAHELNNPASALVRNAKMLLESLQDADSAARAIGATALDRSKMEAVEQTRTTCLAEAVDRVLSPVEQADREDEFSDWLARHQLSPVYAASLADTAVNIKALDDLADTMSGKALETALHWMATGCATRSLALDIERAATRIYELVAAVKRFTYMDKLAGPDSADVEAGLRDTLRVVASKAKAKGAAVVLDIGPELPRAYANGGALNQVWLNLIDNALDAIPNSGSIHITARHEHNWVVVRLVDNGTGIPPDIMPKIFDPFFTTKPPGQGTGLGLDIARRLLRRYHGDISCSSQPGHTEFVVRLLIANDAALSIEQRSTDSTEA
jgi:signal transduction histidine kinase